ncbi:hypothetical protein CWU_02255 [Buchnera aphidicola str. JF98 (Acyrthosiphon pisum)]|nr:hypothetical protein CWU_02255 [Buchnera aphidicola str. JF98 (Acyrthosiphon pisum)]
MQYLFSIYFFCFFISSNIAIGYLIQTFPNANSNENTEENMNIGDVTEENFKKLLLVF